MVDSKFSTITELPNTMVTEEQLQRAHQRYVFASQYIKNSNTLEVGCGGGQGLNILAKQSKSLIGCDIDDSNIQTCTTTYKGRDNIKIDNLNAEELSYADNSFDLIVLFETIYYLNDAKIFLKNMYRMLKDGGYLIISTANKDWPEFNPSPFSTKYYSVPELYTLANKAGFEVGMYASFPDNKDSIKSKIVSFIKRVAVRINLMPKTMRGKVLFKRIFMGKLIKYPTMLEKNMYEYQEPKKISQKIEDTLHTAIFSVCMKPIKT